LAAGHQYQVWQTRRALASAVRIQSRRPEQAPRSSGIPRRSGRAFIRPPFYNEIVVGIRSLFRRQAVETEIMGRVLTEAKIENLKDVWDCERGRLPPEEVHSITVLDALVDTGATLLSLPTRMIRQLGLAQVSTKRVRSSAGPTMAGLYEAVRLTIQDRSCTMDVLEVPDSVPVLIGQIPLEHLDLVIDMRSQSLTGNPAHGGEHVYEMY
jgi:predicted aspartyl protease